MNTNTATCEACKGLGEICPDAFAHYVGVCTHRECQACNGTGAHLCPWCSCNPATAESVECDSPECAECAAAAALAGQLVEMQSLVIGGGR